MLTIPYLSVIIPCYNCRKTIERLLDSIVANGFSKDELEVIICDDKSTDNFLSLVKPYEEKLNIKYCKTTRELHCPGNTREAALPYATGKWIAFIDNDDMFEPDAFSKARDYIETHDVPYILCTSFREWDPNKEQYTRDFIGEVTDTWLHGKFFNRVELLEKFNIHFKDDLYSHEDVYFNSTILGNLIGHNLDYVYAEDIFTYKWVINPQSISRSYYNTNHFYIETYLNDYIMGASYPYFDMIDQYPEHKSFYVHQIMMTLLHAFFYFDASKYRLGANNILTHNITELHDFKVKICNELKISEIDIINYIYRDAKLYNNIKRSSISGSNEFIESQSFKDFILSI